MNTMKQKKHFIRPAVLQELNILPETPILAASIVEQTTVTTTGQPVETIDWEASGNTFNHQWN